MSTTPQPVAVVRMNVNVDWEVTHSEDYWVGACDTLGLTVQSDSWSHLIEDISDAMQGLFETLLEDDQMDQFLNEHGWTLESDVRPTVAAPPQFAVPFRMSLAA